MSFKEQILGGEGDEELVLEPKQKKKPTQEVFQIERFLAAGSFNCAHLVRDRQGKLHVLRLAYLYDNTNRKRPNDMVKRGLEILHIFQNYKGVLGPSLLEETSPYRIFPETEENDHVVGAMCEKIRELQMTWGKTKGNVFALQHVEYLQGGEFSKSTGIDKSYNPMFAFSLLWFLDAAQRVFDFRHHDLKPENIVFRKTETIQEYNFNWNSSLYFHIQTHYVPVVIDYDFASVKSTQDKIFRNTVGTLYAGSPDAHLYWIHHDNKLLYTKPYNEDVLDWWSLGFAILELYVPHLDDQFYEERSNYTSFIMNPKNRRFSLRTSPDAFRVTMNRLHVFFFSCCVAALFNESDSVVPPSEWYPNVQEFFPPQYSFSMNGNRRFVQLRNWLRNPKQDFVVREILPRLFSWEPSRRNFGGESWRFIEMFQHLAERVPKEGALYHFQGAPNMSKVDLPTTAYPLLAQPLKDLKCVGCSQREKLYVCTCCNQIVCGGKKCH